MVGKKKTNEIQPRIKGNFKPSSSDKAARFLVQQTGGLDISIPSFLNSSIQTRLFNSTNTEDQAFQQKYVGFVQDPDVSGLDIRLVNVLKRLEKRDVITKQKSLRDFLDLLNLQCNGNDEQALSRDSVVAVLPFWPRIYSRLSSDSDRKVRELNQSVMHALATCVGKELVVYLKQIFPIWVFATSDSHELEASIASRGLSDIFPGSKLSNANRLCVRQLLDSFDARISELFANTQVTVPTVNKTDGEFENTHVGKQKTSKCDNNQPKAICQPKLSITELALGIRFLTCFIHDLGHLPPDHKQLTRVRTLLSPNCLWNKLAQYLDSFEHKSTTKGSRQIVGDLSNLYSAVYKMFQILCNSDCWSHWLKETEDGTYLAKYICAATVGTLGLNLESNMDIVNKKYMGICMLIPYPELSNNVHTIHWEASLTCLTNLSNNFVWSIVDWRKTFVPRLKYMLLNSGKSFGKHLHKNLLCLLNTFPVDFKNITKCDEHILNDLFVDASLTGLKHSLRLLPNSESGSGLSDDPNHLVCVVSGILECCRYLIDRLLTDPVDDDHHDDDIQSPRTQLANRIYEEIVIRLLHDCLNICHTKSSVPITRLVCNHLPFVRQSYLDMVFNQIAKLINNLANSNKNNLKLAMFERFRSQLLDWIQFDNSHSIEVEPIDGEHNRLFIGIVDPLRLIKFIEHLAKSNHSKFDRNASHLENMVPVAQCDWCLHLFRIIGECLASNIMIPTQCPSNLDKRQCFPILVLLCLSGHLPVGYFANVCIVKLVFRVLIPELPSEFLSVCWSPAVVSGLIKSWPLASQTMEEDIGILPANICLNFVNHLLPKLLDTLSEMEKSHFDKDLSLKSVSDHLGTMLCSWTGLWFDQSLDINFHNLNRTNTGLIHSAVNNLYVLLVQSFQSVSTPSSLTLTIRSKIIETLAQHVINKYDELLNCDIQKFPPIDKLRSFGSIVVYLLEFQNYVNNNNNVDDEIDNNTINTINNNNDYTRVNRLLYAILIKLLVTLYQYNYFSKVKTSTHMLLNYTDIILSKKSEDGDDDLCLTSFSTDELCVNFDNQSHVLTIGELINRSESLILDGLIQLCNTLDPFDPNAIKSHFNTHLLSSLVYYNPNHNQLIEVFLLAVVDAQFVPPHLCDFILHFYSVLRDKSDTSDLFSSTLLNYIINQTNNMLQSIYESYSLPMVKSRFLSRHLLPNFTFLSMCLVPKLRHLVRLHQIGQMLHIHLEPTWKQESGHMYMLCMGLLRSWISSLNEPFDMCSDFGWPSQYMNMHDVNSRNDTFDDIASQYLEPVRSSFGKVGQLFVRKLGSFWHEMSGGFSIEQLMDILNEYLPILVDKYHARASHEGFAFQTNIRTQLAQMGLNALLLNRVRTVHPNLWPNDLKRVATCTEDYDLSSNQSISWSETYLTNLDKNQLFNKFNQCLEFYLPAGIIKRCLPRQELLGYMKSFSLSLSDHHDSKKVNTNDDDDDLLIHANVMEMISSLINVRPTAPIYITTFSSIILEDYQCWLTSLADSMSEDPNICITSPHTYRTTISAMSYLESLFLLWQPWQWSLFESEKSPISTRLGLIQLSMRIRQLRPCLTSAQWDFVLCIITSWVSSIGTNCSNDTCESDCERTIHNLLAFRAYRVATTLGAIFIKRRSIVSQLGDLFINPKTDSDIVPDPLDNINATEDNDNTAFEDEEPPVDEFLNEADYADEVCDTLSVDQKQIDELLSSDSFTMDLDEELDIGADSDPSEETELGDNSDDFCNAIAKGMPLVPKRGQAPGAVQKDWNSFFANHLYSNLLPIVFKLCVPIKREQYEPLIDTISHVQALCAAFATCPANQLIQILTDQPGLVLEYLMDMQLSTKKSSMVPNQILQAKDISITDFTLGFRAGLDLACRLMTHSSVQSGQLLGYILLNRLIATQILHVKTKKPISIANHLIFRLPTLWLSSLYGILPRQLENYLSSESAFDHWGKGSLSLLHLTSSTSHMGWALNCQMHQSILGYLLSWDSFLSLIACVGPQTRAHLQNALLGPSSVLFDRFMLLMGLLLPPPGNMDDYINLPCRLEPDERLLLLNSTSRMYLATALSICSPRRYNRRPIHLITPLVSGDDREWRDLFGPDDPLLCLPGHRVACDLNHFAVRLFRRFLAEVPSLLRSWHGQLSSRTAVPNSQPITLETSPIASQRPGRLRQLAISIDKIVSRYFSPVLARDETVLVQYRSYLRLLNKERNSSKGLFSFLKSTPEDGSVQIKSRPLSREVIATYYLGDEHSMEMIIQLPSNYPLSLTTVSKCRGVGVSTQQWQSWIIQLSVFINNHNGSILDGIDLWQRNVRKRFEGVEECAICYSIVHNSNFSLPKMQCHVCKKLFHHACMYKWFTTSRNPACPLCRHLFFNPTGRPIS